MELPLVSIPEIPETNELPFCCSVSSFVSFYIVPSICVFHYAPIALPSVDAAASRRGENTSFILLAKFHPDQPPADSPKHQQKIDKNSPGSNNNSGGGGGGAAAAAAALSGVGSSATLPSQGSHLPLGSVEAQLKYENDRLKLALAQR